MHVIAEHEISLTAYRIGIEVQEKPWGGEWGTPEDNGARTIYDKDRPWYHLWTVNENAIRATVQPQCLVDMVEDTSFHYYVDQLYSSRELATRKFLPGESSPPIEDAENNIGLEWNGSRSLPAQIPTSR